MVKNDRVAASLPQPHQDTEQQVLIGKIKGSCGFIEHENFGLCRQCPRKQDDLPLAAGKVNRKSVLQIERRLLWPTRTRQRSRQPFRQPEEPRRPARPIITMSRQRC